MDLLVDFEGYLEKSSIVNPADGSEDEEAFYRLVSLLNKCLEQYPTSSIKKLCASVFNNLYDCNVEQSSSSSSSSNAVVSMAKKSKTPSKDSQKAGGDAVLATVQDKDAVELKQLF